MNAHDAQKEAWEEGLALGLLEEVGTPDPPIDALELAHACSLEVRYGGRARLVDGVIYVPRKATGTRLQWLVAHELGHWLLARSRELQGERNADAIARALLLPRYALLHDIRELGDDFEALAARHPNAAPDVIRTRVEALRAAF